VFTAALAGSRIVVTNRGSASVYLGSSTVTDANGYELAQDESLELLVSPGGVLFAVAAAGSHPVHILAG
jgi:hypothetical protein